MAAPEQQPQGAIDYKLGYQAESETNQSEYSSVSHQIQQKMVGNRKPSQSGASQIDNGLPPRGNNRGMMENNNYNDPQSKKIKRNMNLDGASKQSEQSSRNDISPNKKRMLRNNNDNNDDDADQFYSLQHSSITANAGVNNKISIKQKGIKKVNPGFDKGIRPANGTDHDSTNRGYFSQKNNAYNQQQEGFGMGSPMRASSNVTGVNNDSQLQKSNTRNSVNMRKYGSQVSKPSSTNQIDQTTRQPTETSDFMNRFKGKITTMNKDGHLGIVQKTSQPVNKMDYIGFQSGMSGVSSITAQPVKPQNPIYKPSALDNNNNSNNAQMNATNNSNINLKNQQQQQDTAYQPFRQNTNNQLNQSVIELKNRRNTNNYTQASYNQQPALQNSSFVNAQQYATPQQESSYKFPLSQQQQMPTTSGPNAYGHNSNRVYGNQYNDSNSYLQPADFMNQFGGNTSASQRFQRQMIKSSPYNLDGGINNIGRPGNDMQQDQLKTSDGLPTGQQRLGSGQGYPMGGLGAGAPYDSEQNPPPYVPTQFQSMNSADRIGSGSFRHQNRNLIASKGQANIMSRQNVGNASGYKKISNQRPSVYRNVGPHNLVGKAYENTIGPPEEEGETANFGAMMEFHHSPQQDFFKRNPGNNQLMGNAMDNSNGLQIGRLRMPRDSFHQSGAMSDSGAAHGRPYRSNSHTNLDPKTFLSPIAGNNSITTGFNQNGVGGVGISLPQSQAKTQDRRFDRGPGGQFDQYSAAAAAPPNHLSFIQRRHKTPNELSSGIAQQGTSNLVMATPIKSSINIGTAKSKFSEHNRIQKYPPDSTPAPFRGPTGGFDIGKHLDNNSTHHSLMNVPGKRKDQGTLMTVHNDRQLFGHMPGLGPVNVGTQEWNLAKAKQQRMNSYVNSLSQMNRSGHPKKS